MLVTRNLRPSLWESVLPEICGRLPADLERAGVHLDAERFLDPLIGRPSIPMEPTRWLMFLK